MLILLSELAHWLDHWTCNLRIRVGDSSVSVMIDARLAVSLVQLSLTVYHHIHVRKQSTVVLNSCIM